MRKIKLRPVLLIALIFIQCSVDDVSNEFVEEMNVGKSDEVSVLTNTDSKDTSQTSFNHQAMLMNWADNIIIPSLSGFESSLSELKTKASEYTSSPNAETLSVLRAVWLDSYLKWQHVEMFDIGTAEEIYFKNRINLFPANIDRIESNIANQEYDLDQSSNFTSQGFNSLDYLLFGLGENDNAINDKYASENSNYSKYLIEVIDKMIALTSEIKEGWNEEFRNSFINSTENTSTSSVNMVLNDFIFYFEKGFRANKVGIPSGVFSDLPLPDRVEAYYSKKYSRLLALEANKAIRNFFNGKYYEDNEQVGLSVRDYLDYLESDEETKLSDKINNQLDSIDSKLNSLNPDFTQQIIQDNLAMLYAFDVIQANVVLLKVDMLQKLNINVDYADADGD